MDEYIKREYAVDAVLDVYCDTPDIDLSGEKFESAILKIQAADVAPVRHGRWERIGIKGRKGLPIYPCCSVCGIVSAAFRSEWEGIRGPWKFCPNCGAKMDGDADE